MGKAGKAARLRKRGRLYNPCFFAGLQKKVRNGALTPALPGAIIHSVSSMAGGINGAGFEHVRDVGTGNAGATEHDAGTTYVPRSIMLKVMPCFTWRNGRVLRAARTLRPRP